MKDGHLFLSLKADGGIYEFEPAPEDEILNSIGIQLSAGRQNH